MGLFDYPTEPGRPADASARRGAYDFVFLEDLPKESWAEILAIVEKHYFRAGDDIVQIGDRDDSFYILTSGSVSVMLAGRGGRLYSIDELSAGSVFGEIAFF